MGCWEEYGKPVIDSPEVRQTVLLVKRVYEFSGVGGNLHVVVDDWNLEDACLDSCEKFIKENPNESGPDQIAAETECLNALRRLSEEERAAVMARYDGYIAD